MRTGLLIFGSALAVLGILANLLITLHDDREKKTESTRVHAELERIHQGVSELVAKGRITREEARRIFPISLGDALELSEDLKVEKKGKE